MTMKTIRLLCAFTITSLGLALLAAQTKPAAAPAQPTSAPVYSAWPFDANEAARRQDETAKALGMKKELSLDLGKNVSLKLVLIPAGTFAMGSPKDEKDRTDIETQHEVTLSKPFCMGVYPVTQQQYEQVTGKNPSGFKGAANPVEMMSWDEAVDFCNVLSMKTGKSIRLPTEAEWEYACRAGTATPFNTGDTISTDQANYNGGSVYGNGKAGVFREKTIPVGTFKPSAFGLYDMHGNVLQWCSDWCDKAYYGVSPQSDPQGAATGTFRALRGGSWTSAPSLCRSACRTWNMPGHRVGKIGSFGFRVVCDLEKK
jgi:formylglycine-generating enzyme required for sulfatase activity